MYQRNQFCSVIGAYLEVKDIDVASNFIMTHKLRPAADGESPVRINANFGAEDKDIEDDFDSLPCATLLRFSSFKAPGTNNNFYQRALPKN